MQKEEAIDSNMMETSETKKPFNKKLLIIVLVSVFAVLVIAIAGVVVWNKSISESPEIINESGNLEFPPGSEETETDSGSSSTTPAGRANFTASSGGGGGGGGGSGGGGSGSGSGGTTTSVSCTNDSGCESIGLFCEGNSSYNCVLGGDGCLDKTSRTSCGSDEVCVSGQGCMELTQCTADSNCSYLDGVCGAGTCNLNSSKCEASYNSSASVCRSSAGECDMAEYCTGSSVNCPGDLYKISGTECSEGFCDSSGVCKEKTLFVSLIADPARGNPPLNGVSLSAAISGTATGLVNYYFYCDSEDDGTSIILGYAARFDSVSEPAKTASNLCNYDRLGTYYPKVIVERGGVISGSRTSVFITDINYNALATTVRVGEQDTCDITDVTTSGYNSTAKDWYIKFNLDELNGKEVVSAKLKMWVSTTYKSIGLSHDNPWDDSNFSGLEVEQIGSDKPPVVSYPFTFTAYGLHEWDVTSTVQEWLANTSSNKGFRTNFNYNNNKSLYQAWMLPYLEINYGGAGDIPQQANNLSAFYRSGQVFITWKQPDYEGAFFDSNYKIYKFNQPINSGNINNAELVGEVNKNSQLNYWRTANSWNELCIYTSYQHYKSFVNGSNTPIRYNYVIDDSWPYKIQEGKWLTNATTISDNRFMFQGPELADDAGLFVYRVKKNETAYFAVTSVVEGQENKVDFSDENSLQNTLNIKDEPIKPVLQVVFNERSAGYSKYQIREYVYWADPYDNLHNEPSTPVYFRIGAPLYFVGLSSSDKNPFISIDPVLGGAISSIGVDMNNFLPTKKAPFVATYTFFGCNQSQGGLWNASLFYYGSHVKPDFRIPYGYYTSSRNFYGYYDKLNTGEDPRTSIVYPYYENRALKQLDFFFNEFPQIDKNRIGSYGGELGAGSGQSKTFVFGIHHPETISHVASTQTEIWSIDKPYDNLELLVGKKDWQLKNDLGYNVWDYNDVMWYSKNFPNKSWPFISNTQSVNNAGVTWNNRGYPQFYLDLEDEKRGVEMWWVDIGDSPRALNKRVPLNESYPAFTNVNFAEIPVDDYTKEPRGSMNGYLIWYHNDDVFRNGTYSTSPLISGNKIPLDLIDEENNYEISIKIDNLGLSLNGNSVPSTKANFGRTDITLWRLQKFEVIPGQQYLWLNKKVMTGQLLQAGLVSPDEYGRITIPGFFVDKDVAGNKLIITPYDGTGIPSVNMSNVHDLSYGEYVEQCTNPLMYMYPIINATRSEFNWIELYNQSIFMDYWDSPGDIKYRVLEPGKYRVDIAANGSYGVGWPKVGLIADGVSYEYKVIDSNEKGNYTWWNVYLENRNLQVGFKTDDGSGYYRRIYDTIYKSSQRRAHFYTISFTKQPLEGIEIPEVSEINIWPRAVSIDKRLGVKFKPELTDQFGNSISAPVSFSSSGGAIDSNGVFNSDYGVYTVSVSSNGLDTKTWVNVTDEFSEDFNSREYGGSWRQINLKGDGGSWYFPPGNQAPLQSLKSVSYINSSMLVFEGGYLWDDYEAQVDIPNPQSVTYSSSYGLVFRAQENGDHYRFEINRVKNISRLIKNRLGIETILAETNHLPNVADFDVDENPMCFTCIENHSSGAYTSLSSWKLDRIRVEARGSSLNTYINNVPVFTGIVDDEFSVGTIGLYYNSSSKYSSMWFDNIFASSGNISFGKELRPVGYVGELGSLGIFTKIVNGVKKIFGISGSSSSSEKISGNSIVETKGTESIDKNTNNKPTPFSLNILDLINKFRGLFGLEPISLK